MKRQGKRVLCDGESARKGFPLLTITLDRDAYCVAHHVFLLAHHKEKRGVT